MRARDWIRLHSSQIAQAAATLARAFHADPLMRRLFSADAERARMLPHLFDASVRDGCLFGDVYAGPALEGVAVWLPPGRTALTFRRMLRAGMLTIPFRVSLNTLRQLIQLASLTHRLHLRCAPGPHWYLLQIGVDPAAQGRGIGGLLLQPALAHADADGRPCYLETQNEANLSFCAKHGFQVVAEGGLPGGGCFGGQRFAVCWE